MPDSQNMLVMKRAFHIFFLTCNLENEITVHFNMCIRKSLFSIVSFSNHVIYLLQTSVSVFLVR